MSLVPGRIYDNSYISSFMKNMLSCLVKHLNSTYKFPNTI